MNDTLDGPVRVAAIDIGTNSVRMIVGEVEAPDRYRVLDDEREQTRLGLGLHETGRLAAESVSATLDALERMKAIAEGFGVAELRAVATAALREAENGEAVVEAARKRCGLRLDVISPDEEAELALRSVRRHFPLEGPAAIVDIGGGSMEIVFTTAGLIEEIHSLPLGALRLTDRFVHSDPIDDSDWRALRAGIDHELKNSIGKPPFPTPTIIGSGGTFTAVALMAMYERRGELGPVQGYSISVAEVDHQLRRIREASLARRRSFQGLNPNRADIILAGAAAVSRLAKRLDASQVIINDRGIRDGIMLEMISRLMESSELKPDRLDAARDFARKCRSNVRHSKHVTRLAANLFDALSGLLGLGGDDRELLLAAATMHDVGYLIGYKGHHKHAYHLIRHSSLQGYSAYELELIANVARYHRRALPKLAHDNFARINKKDRDRVRGLAALLRLADGLDRTHTQKVKAATLADSDTDTLDLLLTVSGDPWIELQDAERKSDLLAATLQRTIRFRVDQAAP